MKLADVRIEVIDADLTILLVNGKEMPFVTGYTIIQKAGELPKITIDVIADDVIFDGKAEVILNKLTSEDVWTDLK